MSSRTVWLLIAWLSFQVAPLVQAAGTNLASGQAAEWRDQALALEHGEGVGRDVDAAVGLYCKAAIAGDMQARYRLGWIYAIGRGVDRVDSHASYLFQLAAEQGDEVSRTMLSTVGPSATKPPCVLDAEIKEAEQQARQAALAEAERIAALEAAEAAYEVAQIAAREEELEKRYMRFVDSAARRQILAIVQRLAPQYGINPALAVALIRAESNFDPQAVSGKNAQGLMQLIPETATRFRVMKPFDPEQNIRGGLAYLRWLLAYFQGNVDWVVAAYNAGEGAVDRFGGVPPYPETRGYVKRIREVFFLPTHPFDQRITDPSPKAYPYRNAAAR